MMTYDSEMLSQNKNTMAEFFKMADYKTIYTGPTNEPSLPLHKGIERGFETITSSMGDNLESWDKSIAQLIENNNNRQSTFLFLHTYWVHSPFLVNDVSDGNQRKFTNDYYGNISPDEESYKKSSQEFLNYVIYLYENELKDDVVNKKTSREIVYSLKRARNLIEAEMIYNSIFNDLDLKDLHKHEFYFSEVKKSPETIDYTKSLYDEMIYYLDKKLVSIFDLVSKTELAKNTIIIITSDHGEEFMEHGEVEHPADHLYNTTTSVPLIMYIPGVKQKKIDDLVQSIDILPTVLGLTGIKKLNTNFDGIDLTDSIIGNPGAIQNSYLISEGPGIDSIRDDQWKLYVKGYQLDGNYLYELYDLKNDPLEIYNLAQEKPQIVQNLHDNLDRIIYKR